MKRVAYQHAMPCNFNIAFPYAKRSRMTTFTPLTIYSHGRCDSRLSCGSATDGAFLTPSTDAAQSHFLTLVSFLLPSVLIWVHFYQPGGVDRSNSGICFIIEYRR